MRVTPVKPAGSQVVHLATSSLDGLGGDYTPVCPGGKLITTPLQLVASDERFVWCPACLAWATEAKLDLPQPDRSGSG